MVTKNLTIDDEVEILTATKLFGNKITSAKYEGPCNRHYLTGAAISFIAEDNGVKKRLSTPMKGLDLKIENGKKRITIPLTHQYIISQYEQKFHPLYEAIKKAREQAEQYVA